MPDLEDEQVITFNDAQNQLYAGPPTTTLTAFFGARSLHPNMRHFTYTQSTFQLQKKRQSSHDDCMADTVGCIQMIAFNPHTAELFYLCMLLYRVPVPTSFRNL